MIIIVMLHFIHMRMDGHIEERASSSLYTWCFQVDTVGRILTNAPANLAITVACVLTKSTVSVANAGRVTSAACAPKTGATRTIRLARTAVLAT